MESSIRVNEIINSKPPFPALYEYVGHTFHNKEQRKFIILFDSETSGIVVYSDNPGRPLGQYSTNLASCFIKDSWKRLPENQVVELRN